MRLIDADALLDDCTFSSKELETFIREFINDAPTVDAVPVVRCKDCKWWDGIDGSPCVHPDCRNPIHCNPGEFCNCGEKNEKR